jgi:hypothetical protein
MARESFRRSLVVFAGAVAVTNTRSTTPARHVMDAAADSERTTSVALIH